MFIKRNEKEFEGKGAYRGKQRKGEERKNKVWRRGEISFGKTFSMQG